MLQPSRSALRPKPDPLGRDGPDPVERLHVIARDALARVNQDEVDRDVSEARRLFGFKKMDERLKPVFLIPDNGPLGALAVIGRDALDGQYRRRQSGLKPLS